MRKIMPSIFFAMRTMPTTSIIHGIMAVPFGALDIALISSLTNTRLNTISAHMDANIRSQPRKISAVDLEPPMANANAGHHRPHCLKDQVADQQRPAHREKDGADIFYHRHTIRKIG